MVKILTCYATGQDREWEAICVDLDIAVQGDSFSDVYTRLNEAIADYVYSVVAESPAQVKRLMSRAAPWRVRRMQAVAHHIPPRSKRHAQLVEFCR